MWKTISGSGKPAPFTSNYNPLKDALTAAMQEVITSKTDKNIQAVLKKYQDEFNARYGGQS
jgi:hypothetical protein